MSKVVITSRLCIATLAIGVTFLYGSLFGYHAPLMALAFLFLFSQGASDGRAWACDVEFTDEDGCGVLDIYDCC